MDAAPHGRTVTLAGIDAGDQVYWTWEWADGSGPGASTTPADALRPVLRRLDAALPGFVDADRDDELVLASLPGWERGLRERAERVPAELHLLAMAHRCLTGELADPRREAELARALGNLLLPVGLVAELDGAEGDRPLVRVLPPASCVRVPWELLALPGWDDDRRLVEVADVVTVAPLLTRDGDPDRPHPSWSADASGGPLLVVDPAHGRAGSVLLDHQREVWVRRLGSASPGGHLARGAVGEEWMDRVWLSEQLRAVPPPSRLLFVGHVELGGAGDGRAERTGLLLGGLDRYRADAFGHSDGGAMRTLTARDLLAGTREMDPDTDPAAVPAPGRRHRGVEAVAGDALWPMPPRVALLACQSGTDLGDSEPFGLVTAVLELGAELVTATRWPLLTDVVHLVVVGPHAAAEPLGDLVREVDAAHDDIDPVRRLARWQRARLDAWRREPAPASSPLTWAAVTCHDAPDRTPRTSVVP